MLVSHGENLYISGSTKLQVVEYSTPLHSTPLHSSAREWDWKAQPGNLWRATQEIFVEQGSSSGCCLPLHCKMFNFMKPDEWKCCCNSPTNSKCYGHVLLAVWASSDLL